MLDCALHTSAEIVPGDYRWYDKLCVHAGAYGVMFLLTFRSGGC